MQDNYYRAPFIHFSTTRQVSVLNNACCDSTTDVIISIPDGNQMHYVWRSFIFINTLFTLSLNTVQASNVPGQHLVITNNLLVITSISYTDRPMP